VTLSPSPILDGVKPYAPPPLPAAGTLKVDFNEGPLPDDAVRSALSEIDTDALRRYPDARTLTEELANTWNISPDRVLVTAGGDDALFRICRAMLDPSSSAVMTDPTFEMIPRYADLTGAELRRVPWHGDEFHGEFPLDAVLKAADATTKAVFVVSPNNPTGLTARAEHLRTLSEQLPQALIVLDAAYGEFDSGDLTADALQLPNAVVVRTFSKAFGLAALRVGYAMGSAEVIRWLNAAGNPFPCAQPSLDGALHALRDAASLQARIDRIITERSQLLALLASRGVHAPDSKGNFVLAPLGERAERVDASLKQQGVLVRRFAPPSPVAGALRITCPGNAHDFDRLSSALANALAETAS